MMSADEIRDGESLKAWLTGRPRGDAVLIASRAGCRIAPLVLARPSMRLQFGDGTSLPLCRALLIAGVASRQPIGSIEAEAGLAATDAFDAAYKLAGVATTVPIAISRIVNVVRDAPDYFEAVSAAVDATKNAAVEFAATNGSDDHGLNVVAGTIWDQVQKDAWAIEAGYDPSSRALWTTSAPEWFRSDSAEFRRRWELDPAFIFWLRWWEGIQSGQQIGWALQEKVARLPNEVWAQGAEAVSEEIAGFHSGDGSWQDRQEDPGAYGPSAMLGQNARAVRLQLDTLKIFVEGEIERLKGPNDLTVEEHAARSVRLEMLAKIVEAVTLMREAFDEAEPSAANALVVVEEQLPAVVDNAQAAVDAGGDAQVSGAIISMAAAIQHLTASGASAKEATAIALVDYCLGKLKLLMSRR